MSDIVINDVTYKGIESITVNKATGGTAKYTEGERPSGTINLTTNGTHDVTNYASAVVNIPSDMGMPIEVDNDSDMTNALTQDNVGKVYKFIGNSTTYETDAIYIVSEV